MFDKFRLQCKLKAFRSSNVRCKAYTPKDHIITLGSSGGREVQLAFNLVEYDQKLQLAFSGDVIASDGEALSRVMKVMWNYKLPHFAEEDRLREQLDKQLPVTPNSPPVPDGVDVLASEEDMCLYFRDMAGYVAGMPNEVVVTVKASYRIDNE